MYQRRNYINGSATQSTATRVIDHTSRPVYGSVGSDYWTANEWMQWYYALKRAYGAKYARDVFAQAIDQVGYWDMYHWFGYGSTFRNFIIKEGLKDLDSHVFKDAWAAASSVVGGALSTVQLAGTLIPLLAIGAGIYLVSKTLSE